MEMTRSRKSNLGMVLKEANRNIWRGAAASRETSARPIPRDNCHWLPFPIIRALDYIASCERALCGDNDPRD